MKKILPVLFLICIITGLLAITGVVSAFSPVSITTKFDDTPHHSWTDVFHPVDFKIEGVPSTFEVFDMQCSVNEKIISEGSISEKTLVPDQQSQNIFYFRYGYDPVLFGPNGNVNFKCHFKTSVGEYLYQAGLYVDFIHPEVTIKEKTSLGCTIEIRDEGGLQEITAQELVDGKLVPTENVQLASLLNTGTQRLYQYTKNNSQHVFMIKDVSGNRTHFNCEGNEEATGEGSVFQIFESIAENEVLSPEGGSGISYATTSNYKIELVVFYDFEKDPDGATADAIAAEFIKEIETSNYNLGLEFQRQGFTSYPVIDKSNITYRPAIINFTPKKPITYVEDPPGSGNYYTSFEGKNHSAFLDAARLYKKDDNIVIVPVQKLLDLESKPTCGIAYTQEGISPIMTTPTYRAPSHHTSCSYTSYTIAHELMHLWFADHNDREYPSGLMTSNGSHFNFKTRELQLRYAAAAVLSPDANFKQTKLGINKYHAAPGYVHPGEKKCKNYLIGEYDGCDNTGMCLTKGLVSSTTKSCTQGGQSEITCWCPEVTTTGSNSTEPPPPPPPSPVPPKSPTGPITQPPGDGGGGSSCGNGVKETGEECENNSHCTKTATAFCNAAVCKCEDRCLNGVWDLAHGEQCDPTSPVSEEIQCPQSGKCTQSCICARLPE